MKRVEILLDDKYSDVLSITAVGNTGTGTNVSVYVVDLSKGNQLIIDEHGKGHQNKVESNVISHNWQQE